MFGMPSEDDSGLLRFVEPGSGQPIGKRTSYALRSQMMWLLNDMMQR